MGRGGDVVESMEYDPRVKRHSLENPALSHRRSSIPFVDRRPEVRFIRAITQQKASLAGPHDPRTAYNPQKPILKKTEHPILINASELRLFTPGGSQTSTNDELERCRYNTDLVMDRVSKSDRLARGSMDILTFPPSTRRLEALSRYQGCLAVSITALGIFTTSPEFNAYRQENRRNKNCKCRLILAAASDMHVEASSLHKTARKFVSVAKRGLKEWNDMLKKNLEFRIDQARLNYPIYTHKRMPESVTLFEDSLQDDTPKKVDGFIRVWRASREGPITLQYDCESDSSPEEVWSAAFQEMSLEQQVEVTSLVVFLGKELLHYGSSFVSQALEALQQPDLSTAFTVVQSKIACLEYDEYFDPLCALEFKNALGDLMSRKAELLNTAERIIEHCKWLVNFNKAFKKFVKRSLRCVPNRSLLCFCKQVPSKRKVLRLLGVVTVEDASIAVPISSEIAASLFLSPGTKESEEVNSGQLAGDSTTYLEKPS